jgi:hypothetical protein
MGNPDNRVCVVELGNQWVKIVTADITACGERIMELTDSYG